MLMWARDSGGSAWWLSVVVCGCSVANATGIEERASTEPVIVMPHGDRVGAGVKTEHEWIRENFPGWQMISSGIAEDNGKFYDVLKLSGPQGEIRKVYFDITDSYKERQEIFKKAWDKLEGDAQK